ncbi:hypothetical protein [Nocardioides terrigena]|uniref:hypothetical protein n=1 Tax=Nocardioides terrigena TaxID=424797 RepID=UPI000D3267F5|nr:hypothetical protein [Nocardioides terrigena]
MQPDHDRLDRRPFWTVQSVFDPDGEGGDFAYTIGLHDRGLPELHLWARPNRGVDPGEDWMLSPHDRTVLLNTLAWRLLDGALAVGDTWREKFDAGVAVADFELCPPADREHLEAFGIAPGAKVLPVSWSLTRPLEGALTPLTPAARTRAERDLRDAVSALADARRQTPPSSWRPAAAPTFDPRQPFGPLTAVVQARGAQLWGASRTQLNCLLRHAVDVEIGGGSVTFPASSAAASARSVGRTRALEELREAAEALVQRVTGLPRWRQTLDSLLGPGPRESREEASVVRLLRDVVLALLSAEAVADVIPHEWLLAARGPWLTAFGPHGELPGPEWSASPTVLDAVRGLLSPLDARQLGVIAAGHRLSGDGVVIGHEGYADLVHKLNGWALVGSAGCPWRGTLDQLPAWGPLLEGVAGPGVRVELAPLPEFQEWANCLTAALTHRPRLSASEVRAFTLPFEDLLPGLVRLLDEPLTAAS